ncbi:hypothetical protein GIB67_037995, partial [Kingdonia uniflora]
MFFRAGTSNRLSRSNDFVLCSNKICLVAFVSSSETLSSALRSVRLVFSPLVYKEDLGYFVSLYFPCEFNSR